MGTSGSHDPKRKKRVKMMNEWMDAFGVGPKLYLDMQDIPAVSAVLVWIIWDKISRQRHTND